MEDVAARLVAAQPAGRRAAAVTAYGTVAATSPTTVRFGGADDTPVEVKTAVGVTPAVGDVVGCVRFGVRLYVVAILKQGA